MLESEAMRIAEAYLSDLEVECVVTKHRHEAGLGWLFFYNSKRHLETGEFRYTLAGNAPFIVSLEAEIIELGTAYPAQWYVDQLRGALPNA